MNIWLNEEELKKLEIIIKQLKNVKKENCQKISGEQKSINEKYNKYLKYFQKSFWQSKSKIKKYEKMNAETDAYYNNIRLIVSNLHDINTYYLNNLCLKDCYNDYLTEENYTDLYEYFIIIKNYLTNMPKEKMIMESNFIKSKTYKLLYKLRYNVLFNQLENNKYDCYYNSDWYDAIKDYKSIIEIYNDALTDSWSYERFYHISNAFKLFAKIRWEEYQRQENLINKENKELQELPVYLAKINPEIIKTYDKKTLLKTKKDLIKNLQNTKEEEQDKIIESLHYINLTRKM